MRNRRWLWLILSLAFAVILIVAFWKWEVLNPSAEILTKEEAKEFVKSSYQGEITGIKLNGEQYLIEMNKENVPYKITLDAASGEVLSLTKLESKSDEVKPEESPRPLTEEEVKKIVVAESTGEMISLEKLEKGGKEVYKAVVKEEKQELTFEVDAISGSILSSTPVKINEQPKILTESDAANIAAKEVKGSADDVDFETSGDDSYYLVEVETEDDREAVVQIHAITGKVLSITWDDDQDDDN